MDKKYELTDETVEIRGRKLYRIKAIRSFKWVNSGDLGGFVESEYNLSHDGNCWIGDNAKVYNNSRVSDNAIVKGNAALDMSTASMECIIQDKSIIYASNISGRARIYGFSYIRYSLIDARMSFWNAHVRHSENFVYIHNAGTRLWTESITIYGLEDEPKTIDDIGISYRTFVGTFREFIDFISHQYDYDKNHKKYAHILNIARIHFNIGLKSMIILHIEDLKKYFDDFLLERGN